MSIADASVRRSSVDDGFRCRSISCAAAIRIMRHLVRSAIEGPDRFERQARSHRRIRLEELRRDLRRSRVGASARSARSCRTTTISTIRWPASSISSCAQAICAGGRWRTSWPRTSSTSTSTTPIATSRPTTAGCSGTPTTTATPTPRRIARIRHRREGPTHGGGRRPTTTTRRA